MIEENQESKSVKIPSALLLIEFFLIAMAVLLVFSVTGLNTSKGTISFLPSSDPVEYLMLVLSVALFIVIYFSLKRKEPVFFQKQKDVSKDMKEMLKFEVGKAKSDPRVSALMLIQLAFIFAIVMVIAAYLDPDWQIVNWAVYGLQEPFITIVNSVLFIIAAGSFFVLYKFTYDYRK